MTVMTKIGELQLNAASQLLQKTSAELKKKDVPAFSETLKGMLDQVDELQNESGQAVKDFIAGKDIELHEVMAIGQEAKLSFELMLEIRNKLIDAYQELSRMPV